jgi:hypothetical protein
VSARTIRCVACGGRIRGRQPYIGVEDLETGAEFTYHARCQERAAEETVRRMAGGTVLIIHHYHVCGDEAPGADCSGGCFSGAAA